MKKIAVLIVVIVIAILVFVKLIPEKKAVPPDSTHEEPGRWMMPIEVATEHNTFKDIIGTALPKTAKDVRSKAKLNANTGEKHQWLVARIPAGDFERMLQGLDVSFEPHLSNKWPEGFECPDEKFQINWDLSNLAKENAYYGESQRIESRIMLAYGDGKLYVKRTTTYESSVRPNGQLAFRVRVKEP